MLLIVGGKDDHNIQRLANAAEARQAPFRLILTDQTPPPSISWQPGNGNIVINGETFTAKGTSLFIRYDVFSDQNAADKSAIYDAIKGWAEAYPSVGLLNRANETMEVSKPRALVLAQEAGFQVPKTWITSAFNQFADKAQFIAKPVGGGEYTRLLSDMGDDVKRPYIVQQKLEYPEMRLFRVGGHFFAFKVTSNILDYRTDDGVQLEEVEPPKKLAAAMQRLTDRMGLDYAAADLKTDPKTGQLMFLEVNTMPMFTGYDDAAKGRLSDALFLTMRALAGKTSAPNIKPRTGHDL